MPDVSTSPALAAALRRHLLQRFPADRAYPRPAFHAAGMPPLVASFLDRTLDRWVEAERVRFRSEWFDVEDPNVQRAQRQFFAALRRTARIPASAWEEMLGGAIDLVVRFLTTPARALTDAIFEGETDPLSSTTVRARLLMFDAYSYLAEVATAYLDRKQPEALDPDALFLLLDRIDRRFVSEYGLEDWLALLEPLFELARHAPALDGVPTSRLQWFFDAKGEADLADRLAAHEAEALTEDGLRDLLRPAFPGAPEAAGAEEPSAAPAPPADGEIPLDEVPALVVDASPDPVDEAGGAPREAEPPEADGPPSEEAPPEEAPPEPIAAAMSEPPPAEDAEPPDPDRAGTAADASEDDASENGDDGRPLWQRFAERTSDGDSVNARFGAEDEADVHDEAPVPLWKRFFSREGDADGGPPAPDDGPPPARSPLSDVPSAAAPAPPARSGSLDTLERAVLGAGAAAQRARFIKHLFGGDAGRYATVLHTLDRAESWTEASRIIARDVFRPSRVNIYGEHAVAFTDAVEARFRD
jgi:hypothetical protein